MNPPAVRRRAMLLVLSAGSFVALTITAMLVYDGGSIFDSHSRHYLFFGNFFSDLGTTVTYSGRTNTVARTLFVIALASLGLAFAWSAPAWRAWAVHKRALPAAAISQVVAVLCGLGFVGAAVTPQNSERDTHVLLVQVAFTLLLVFVANLVIVQARNGSARSWLGLNIGLLVLLAAYVAIVAVGPSLTTLTVLRMQIAAQKIIVYAAIVNMSLQAWGTTRQVARIPL